jgi:hypothetical protein
MINVREDLMMDALRLIDLLIAIAFAGGGWFMNNVWQSIKDLQKTDAELSSKVASLEVFITKEYVSVHRFELVMEKNATMIDRLGDKIDRLSDKIDTKADRP